MIEHFFPNDEYCENPEVTFVIPAMNEKITIGEFVDWCKEGLKKAGVKGQILIVDSSTDETRAIALMHGAEVLSVPKLGLGRAYIDAIPYIRSPYIIMGDADLTYDTRFIENFVQKFHDGFEFIMGSRFKGTIEKGAMPPLHQYFGTPLTTFILNRVYGCHFSDIHCGMRGVTLDALKRMNLQSQSWQYASEMIIKAIHLNLRYTEVPVIFHKDRDGRLSHHKRTGWYAPWVAGWINLKAIFTFGADFFLYKIGIVMSLLGLLGTTFLYQGPRVVGLVGLSLHWMLFFLLTFLVGLQLFFTGLFAKALYDVEQQRLKKWKKYLSMEYSSVIAFIAMLLGFFSVSPLISEYIGAHFHLLDNIGVLTYHAVAGLGLILFGIIYFTSALIFNAILLMHPSPVAKNASTTPARGGV